MRQRILGLAVSLLVSGAAVWADGPSVSVEWSFAQESNHHAVMVTIKNVSEQDLKVQHPSNRQALAFVVMDDLGNLISPEGVAKVHPWHQDINLKLGQTFKYRDSQLTEWTHPDGLVFPFLTGTGLFAYRLTEGSKYRVTVIYRPHADLAGVASAEQAMTFR